MRQTTVLFTALFFCIALFPIVSATEFGFSPTDDFLYVDEFDPANFSVNFTNNASAVSFQWYLNGTLLNGETNANHTFLAAGQTGNFTLRVDISEDGVANVTREWTLGATDVPIVFAFNGTINDVTSGNVESASGVTIENNFGRINFTEDLNLSRLLFLDDKAVIRERFISLNTSTNGTGAALNASARLTFFNITFIDPVITYLNLFNVEGNARADNCPSSICSDIQYNNTTGVLSFNVSHFSSYGVAENPGPGIFNFTAGESTTIGSDIQRRNTNASGVVTVQNTGEFVITEVTPRFLLGIPTATSQAHLLNVRFRDLPNTTIGPRQSASFGVDAFIPLDFDAATPLCAPSSFSIGTIILNVSNGTTTIERSLELFMQAENKLRIDDADICINSACQLLTNGEEVRDLRPADEMELYFDIKNTFDADNDDDDPALDLDIDSVELTVDIDRGEFDYDDSESESSLGAEGTSRFEFLFDIPDDVNNGAYDTAVTLCGEDEHGAIHGEVFDAILSVEKKAHDVHIDSYRISDTRYSCNRFGSVTVEYTNLGTRDERRANVSVENDDLDISSFEDNLDLEKGQSGRSKLDFTIPDDARDGEYTLKIKTYYFRTAQTDEELVRIHVEDCSRGGSSSSENEGESEREETSNSEGGLELGSGSEAEASGEELSPVAENIGGEVQGYAFTPKKERSPWLVLGLIVVVLVVLLELALAGVILLR